ncbi:unnamed protein product [Effrenium voratum]|uniref:Uncharacterized protein n=1 Tax=Effrenium voratum TaxID=2562239 RepID=A0AA36NB94_9DINO|nr:unnamed protein product [Effrenium voratum]
MGLTVGQAPCPPEVRRAYEYLTSSAASAQRKAGESGQVLQDFKPSNEGEPDYSSLVGGARARKSSRALAERSQLERRRFDDEVTSVVKKARLAVSSVPAFSARSVTLRAAPFKGTARPSLGPSLEELKDFRDRFPMDERAWDFLLSAPGHTQEVVFKDFRPRRLDDADYSAAVWASAFPLFWRFCDRACAPQAAEHAAHANMFSLGAQRSCGGGAFAAALVAGRDRVAAALAEPRKGGWVEVLTPELRVVETLDVAAADLAICGDVLIAGCADGSVQLWDLRAKGKQRQLFSAWEPVQSVSVTDGVCALAAGVSTTLVDLSGQELGTYDVHSQPVSCVRFHPDRPSHLVTGGDDGLMCVLDTTRRPTEEESLHLAMNSEESVERLAFAAEGDVLCSVSSSNVLQLWSLKDPKAGVRCGRLEALRSDPRLKVGESDGHLIDVLSDQSRGYVLAGNTKGRLFLYHLNLEGAEFLEASEGGHSALVRASASVGSAFVTGGEDGRLCLWRRDDGAGSQSRAKRRK